MITADSPQIRRRSAQEHVAALDAAISKHRSLGLTDEGGTKAATKKKIAELEEERRFACSATR